MGVTYDETGLTYQVQSGGCTSKANFELLQRESYPPQIVLVRKVFDACEAFVPYGTKITYTWAELGWQQSMPFVISNPLAQGNFFK
jgi:hypothetical protein